MIGGDLIKINSIALDDSPNSQVYSVTLLRNKCNLQFSCPIESRKFRNSSIKH